MTRIIQDIAISVCTDCICIIANGTVGNGNTDEDVAQAQKMHDYLDGDERYLLPDLPEDDNGGMFFSVFPCGACGTHWSGDRFPARIFQKD